MYIDLNWEVRTNAEFQHKLRTLGKELQIIESKTGSDPAASDKAGSIILDIYRLCKYNAGLLVPYFFPKYPYDKPLSCSNRPYSFAMFHMQIGGFLSIRASRQVGKALSINELCLTPTGYVPMGAVKLGDTVYDRHGIPTLVTGVFPQGSRDMYRMTFTDKSYVDCDEEHLWMCKTNGARHFGVRTLKEIRALKGGDSPTSDQGIRIPLCAPIQLPAVSHYIQPYILGMLLGDGSLTPGNFGFTTSDVELADAFKYQEGITLVDTKADYHYRINKCSAGEYTFSKEADRLDIRHRAEDKRIPNEYLYDSVENRLELLRGLMDTDGTIYGKCQVEFYSVSKVLAEQVQFLVQSLGGTARIKEKQGWYAKDGVRVDCQICYRVKIKIQDINPFKLKRKAEKFYNIRYDRTRILESIKYVGPEEAVCISVASEDKTYITRDCLVTHNSTSIAARQLMYAHIIPKHRSMYIVPHQSYLDTYANRLREMERAFRFYQSHKDYRQNLKYKEYPNGSVTMLVKCLTDTQEARSKTCAEALFDESSHMNTIVHAIVGEKVVEKKISELLVNDTVLAYDTNGTVLPAAVEQVKNKGIKNVWKLKFDNGADLICTGNTRLRTSIGWMFLCEFLPVAEATRGISTIKAKLLLAARCALTPDDNTWRNGDILGSEILHHADTENLPEVNDSVHTYDIDDVKFYTLQDNTLVPTNLTSIEYAGKEEVWDITTATHHTFLANGIAIHNCQFLDPDFIPDIEQCQKSSNMASSIFAGTSTTMESLLETKFQASSQGMWFLRAPGYTSGSAGKGWLNCGDPNDVMKIIQPQGPTNPATGMLLDVADGRFVHQFPDLLDRGYIGFHIPQVIIPDYANVPEKWIEIWEDFEGYDPKKFMQEVLGIPTEEGMREITLQDIKNMCVIPESPATLKDICNQPNGRYKYVVSGCDWGGSDYNPAARTKVSYTVHVILGILWDGSIDIVHMRQYSGMDYRGVAQSICEDHKAYNAIGIASDFGVGAAYNMLLRENPAIQPERHIIFNYVGPQSAIVKAPAGAGWFNQYSLNRTEAITSLYSAIKAGRIRCYAWGMAQDRLLELLNLFRVPTEGPGGGATFKYQRHGSKADDTLHAINFGFALARIILNEPIVEDPTLRRVFNDTFNPAQSQFLNPYGSGGFDMGGHISG